MKDSVTSLAVGKLAVAMRRIAARVVTLREGGTLAVDNAGGGNIGVNSTIEDGGDGSMQWGGG